MWEPAGRVARLVAAGAAACAVPVLYARWGRPRLLTWAAAAEEVSRSYPGEELIPRAGGRALCAALTSRGDRWGGFVPQAALSAIGSLDDMQRRRGQVHPSPAELP